MTVKPVIPIEVVPWNEPLIPVALTLDERFRDAMRRLRRETCEAEFADVPHGIYVTETELSRQESGDRYAWLKAWVASDPTAGSA